MINIILCGVGGQGTVLASKILASAAGARGESAHTAETIGMAQRGGSVVSHVRIGEDAYSPLIAKGCADTIIAFEPAEAVRAFPYLKKGGRITPAAAALGTALRLKPVLQIQGEKLDAFTIARTKKQGVSKMIAAMETDIKERFGGLDNMDNIHIEVAHTANEKAAAEFVEELREHFQIRNEIVCNPLSLSVSCHIGPGALAVACSKAIPK